GPETTRLRAETRATRWVAFHLEKEDERPKRKGNQRTEGKADEADAAAGDSGRDSGVRREVGKCSDAATTDQDGRLHESTGEEALWFVFSGAARVQAGKGRLRMEGAAREAAAGLGERNAGVEKSSKHVKVRAVQRLQPHAASDAIWLLRAGAAGSKAVRERRGLGGGMEGCAGNHRFPPASRERAKEARPPKTIRSGGEDFSDR